MKFSLIFVWSVFVCVSITNLYAQHPVSAVDNFDTLVLSWNNAHNTKDTAALAGLYSPFVLYYGTRTSEAGCIQSKVSLFKKHADYNQQIIGSIQREPVNDSVVTCNFNKRVSFNQQSKEYPSYLIFVKKNGSWKIATEGDAVTDKNLMKAKERKIPKSAVKGDFDGNGTLEYAWLVAPKTTADMDCAGPCSSFIRFSDTTMASIEVKQCVGGHPVNLGDLNSNGSDEIGLLPEWFTSCWSAYYVYTLKHKKWIYAVDPFSTYCDQWEQGLKPIEKDIHKNGNVLIRYTDHETFEVKTKSVPVK